MDGDRPAGRLSVDQLTLAVEVVHDSIVVYDEQMRIVAANDRLLASLDYTRDELLGLPALTLVPEALREELTPRMLAYLGAPVPRELGDGLVTRIRRKDGTTYEAQLANSPIVTASGKLIVVTIRDVQRLSIEEIQSRGLLESNQDATLICTPDSSVVLSNASALRLFEREHVELFDRPLSSLFPDAHAAAVSRRFSECRDSAAAGPVPQETVSLDVDLVRQDQLEVPVEVSISPLVTTQGLMLRVLVRDITERRRLQREAEGVKDGFLATVSHELRTPLTSVLGYGELMEDLEEGDLSPHARSLLEVILRNARRELRLVDDLLTMVHIGDDAFQLHPAPVNLSQLVLDAVEAAAPVAQRAQVRISVAACATDDVFVQGDADRLGQAVDNLLTNSLKFSWPEGEVEVALSIEPETVTVSVANQGAAIHQSDVAHVFDRLYRGNNAIAGEKPGVGLGLSIVRSIVEAHDGTVTAICSGATTRFEIHLPLMPVAPAAPVLLARGAELRARAPARRSPGALGRTPRPGAG